MGHISMLRVRYAVAAVALIAAACFAAAAQATIVVDSNIFSEDFGGATVDSAKWEAGMDNGGTITVAGGEAAFVTTSSGQNAYLTSNGSLNFSGSPDNWGAEVKFTLNGAFSGWTPARNFILLDGLTTSTENGWTNQGFDLRTLREDGAHFSLAWNGWDNDVERNPTVLATGLEAGIAHVAQVHRKADGTVDIYMDGSLVSNQSLLGGVNPTQLRIGDVSGALECNVNIDYVKVGGIVPEPSAIVLLATSVIGLVAYAWRKRR